MKKIETKNLLSDKQTINILDMSFTNLLIAFVSCISVMPFFAHLNISVGGLLFSAQVITSMIAASTFILILENYKDSTKVFFAGAYTLLLVFFLSVFIFDYGVDTTIRSNNLLSFLDLQQITFLAIFVSYITSFIMCMRIFFFVKEAFPDFMMLRIGIPIFVSQAFYTIIYHYIFFGFLDTRNLYPGLINELSLKFFLFLICMLLLHLVINLMMRNENNKKNISKESDIDLNDHQYALNKPLRKRRNQKNVTNNEMLLKDNETNHIDLDQKEETSEKNISNKEKNDYLDDINSQDDKRITALVQNRRKRHLERKKENDSKEYQNDVERKNTIHRRKAPNDDRNNRIDNTYEKNQENNLRENRDNNRRRENRDNYSLRRKQRIYSDPTRTSNNRNRLQEKYREKNRNIQTM